METTKVDEVEFTATGQEKVWVAHVDEGHDTERIYVIDTGCKRIGCLYLRIPLEHRPKEATDVVLGAANSMKRAARLALAAKR